MTLLKRKRLPSVCRFFMGGRCSAGAECTNSHDRKHAACRYHWLSKDGCSLEASLCPFWHGEESVESRFSDVSKWERATNCKNSPSYCQGLPKFMLRELFAWSLQNSTWCEQCMEKSRCTEWLSLCAKEASRIADFKLRRERGLKVKQIASFKRVRSRLIPGSKPSGSGWGRVLKAPNSD